MRGERARRPQFRIWAEDSPFELKHRLKRRGYRWNGDGVPKAWYTDVAADMRDAQVAFLREDIYRRDVDPPMREIAAYDRYSARC
jgi:DNA polymerase III subunit epsilon